MYLKKIRYDNIGPVDCIDINTSFTEEGDQKPTIFVGENGCGKSLIVSNIVDACFEIANLFYTNVSVVDHSGTKYFKKISNSQIKIGKKYLCVYIEFIQDNKAIQYFFKSGKITNAEYDTASGINSSPKFIWGESDNYKKVDIEDVNTVATCFGNDIVCYFSPNRYAMPVWMGLEYHGLEQYEHVITKEKIHKNLKNHIIASDVTQDNLSWILDVIVDSRADLIFSQGVASTSADLGILSLMDQARRNIDEILSDIIGQPVCFGLNLRSTNGRLCIKSCESSNVYAPTLDSLSTGQMALLNIFITIIRYADNNGIGKSLSLKDISGIVIIDEVDIHLHAKLQRECLPKLFKKFPKIQFIITSHSPLFLLGMQEAYGAENIEIYQLPNGSLVNAEKFSEFQNAYEYLTSTQTYHDEIEKAIAMQSEIALIVTEGSSDWKHMKAAFNALRHEEQYAEIFDNLIFEFLEYEPKNSSSESALKLEMGGSELKSICQSHSKLHQRRKIIFISDNDDNSVASVMKSHNGDQFKSWGNNVYSCILPVPVQRNDNPEICIEHLYSDEEIKTIVTIGGIDRRLYIGNEFDEFGRGVAIHKLCIKQKVCGPTKISIIDGTCDARVISPSSAENETNYALPKALFADNVLAKTPPFDSFNFDNFVPLFRIIKAIIAMPMQS